MRHSVVAARQRPHTLEARWDHSIRADKWKLLVHVKTKAESQSTNNRDASRARRMRPDQLQSTCLSSNHMVWKRIMGGGASATARLLRLRPSPGTRPSQVEEQQMRKPYKC